MTKLIAILSLASLIGCASGGDKDKDKGAAAAAASSARRIDISVTEEGFQPDQIQVDKGTPVTLVFTRKTDSTCAKEVVLHTSDTDQVTRDLPLNKPVEIAATFAKAGELRYACGMDMIKGVVTVN